MRLKEIDGHCLNIKIMQIKWNRKCYKFNGTGRREYFVFNLSNFFYCTKVYFQVGCFQKKPNQ